MSWQFWSAIGVALITSGVWPVLLPKIIERKNRREEDARRERDAERDTWFKESKHAYDRVNRECSDCNARLVSMRDGFYGLLEDLEDQIIPMLILPDADPEQIKIAMRASVRRARQTVALSLTAENRTLDRRG